MKAKIAAFGGAVALLALQFCVAPETVRAADPTPADLVDALNAVFGKPVGTRSAHAKGFCLTGKFTPAPEAAKLSKAAHFAKPVPITARFSLGGGNAQAPDNDKGNVRGLAIRFDLGNGAFTDLVMISAPVFFVQTPALFVEFLQTVGSGDKAKLDAFFAAHPESTRQAAWLNSHPVPASYAGVDYFGVHAFTFTNADGDKALVKYKAVPDAGELGLSDEEAESQGRGFLRGGDEGTARQGSGLVRAPRNSRARRRSNQRPDAQVGRRGRARDDAARQDQHRGAGARLRLRRLFLPSGKRDRRRRGTGGRPDLPDPIGGLHRLVHAPAAAMS